MCYVIRHRVPEVPGFQKWSPVKFWVKSLLSHLPQFLREILSTLLPLRIYEMKSSIVVNCAHFALLCTEPSACATSFGTGF